jgi:P2 family phage major capsid protein
MKTAAAGKLARAYKNITAKIYGVKNVGETFNVEPRIAQKIEEKVQQSNSFLNKINFVPVREISGDVLAFGAPKTLMKRTNTADRTSNPYGKRRPTDPSALIQRQYKCNDYESDALIAWNKIDQWVHLPNFYERFRSIIMLAKATDHLKVMWNGQFVASDSDPEAYPDLQDMHQGFIQYMIEEAPEQVLGIEPDASADFGYKVKKIKVGAGGDFESLDEIIYMMRSTMIHRTLRKRKTYKAIIGDSLTLNENRRLFGSDIVPTERLARELYLNSQAFGRTEIEESDEFPNRGIFITELSNLSVYYQRTAMRRKIADDHNEKGIVDYEYGREDYPIEVAEGVALVHPDAIQLKDKDGTWYNWNQTKNAAGDYIKSQPDWKIELP